MTAIDSRLAAALATQLRQWLLTLGQRASGWAGSSGSGPRAHRRRARRRASDLGRDVDPDDPGGRGAVITAVGVALEIVDLARPPDDPVSVVATNVFHRMGRLRHVPAGTPVRRRRGAAPGQRPDAGKVNLLIRRRRG